MVTQIFSRLITWRPALLIQQLGQTSEIRAPLRAGECHD
jgi:hypothetical protein